jgi:hypothetical protein
MVAPLALQVFLLLGGLSQGGFALVLELLPEVLWVDSYVAAIGLLVWATEWSATGRLALFLAIVWLLPGLLADGGLLERFMAPIAGPLLSEERMFSFAPTRDSALPRLVGQCALFASAWFFIVPRRTSRK